MNLAKNIKDYFNKKEKGEKTGPAPEGVCPNCWGTYEYDGEYYKFIKGQNKNPSEDLYDSFVADVARKLGEVTVRGNEHICQTCNVSYKHTH